MAATGAAKVGGTHIYFIDLFLSQMKKKKKKNTKKKRHKYKMTLFL